MSEEKITVTWDEIQKHDRPASNFPAGFPLNGLPEPARPKRRGVFIVVCILVGLLILGGAGAGAWFWLIKTRSEAMDIKTRSEAMEIEQVLEQDARCKQGATSIAEVVGRMKAIDTSACPNDFRAAYLAHLHAWEAMADLEQEAIALKKEHESVGTMLEGFIRGLLGDPFGKAREIMDARGDLQKKIKEADKQIKLTFQRVQEIAVAHGARVPATRGKG